MQSTNITRFSNFIYLSLLLLGLLFIFLSFAISESFFLRYVVDEPGLDPQTINEIRILRTVFFLIGLVLIILTLLLKKFNSLESFFSGRLVSTKNTLINLSLLFLSGMFSLIMLEVGLRIIGQGRYAVEAPNPERAIFWHYDDILGWKHSPNQEGQFATPDFNIHVNINSQGLRDRSYSYQRSEDISRIVILGDSFAWGFGVEQDQIFSEIIENELDNVEVINMGVSGYSTDQEYLILKEEGLKYNPQLVLLMIFDNDILENTLNVNYLIYPKPKFSLEDGELVLTDPPDQRISLLRRINYFFRIRLVTYNSLVRILLYNPAKPVQLARQLISGMMLWIGGEEKEDPYEITFALLDEMKELSETHGANFAIVNVATQQQAKEFDKKEMDRLADYSQNNNVPYFNLAESFQDYLEDHPDENLQFTNDPHWNPEAHKIAARIIRSFLMREGLISLPE